MQIHYEDHPVSPERKAELRAHGLTIIDARFKPADGSGPEPEAEPTPEADKPKRGRPAKAEPEPEAE